MPGEFHEQRNLEGYNSWGHKESDTTKCLTLHALEHWYIMTTTSNTNIQHLHKNSHITFQSTLKPVSEVLLCLMYRGCNWGAERRKWPAWDNTHETEWLGCKSVPSGSVLYSQPPLFLYMCTQENTLTHRHTLHTHTHTRTCTAQNTSCGSLISYHDDDQLFLQFDKLVCEARILHLLSMTLGKSLNLSETQSSNCAVGIFTELMTGYLGRAQHGAWTW